MKLARTKQVVFVLATVMSLFVSAVAACACSHHETVKKAVDASSCHGPSHEMPAADNDGQSLETSCNCFVKDPAPAIVSKSEKKKTAIEKRVEEGIAAIPGFVPYAAPVGLVSTDLEPPESNYSLSLLSSLPSRAPPRL